MPTREGFFYPIWPVLDGKALNLQWGQIRSNQAETKAIVRNSVQELGSGDELNALRALLGQEYGDLTFRNKYRFLYNATTKEICCQKNDGTVATPVWTDSWCIRHSDGQFRSVSTGGIYSSAGFYSDDDSLKSMKEIGETGTSADTTVLNPVRLFFNADDGFGVAPIASGANKGAPEITFTQPFGRAEVFSKAGKEWTVNHAFDVTPVMAQVMDADDRIVIPDKADVSDPNTAYFYFNAPFTGSVYIASGGLGAATLLPRDPFYMVIRTDEQSREGRKFTPNVDMIFDATDFYVNVDLDEGSGGAHKNVRLSLTDAVKSPFKHDVTFQKHVRMDDSLSVENVITAEGFYLTAGSGGEISKSGDDLLIKSFNGQVVINDELRVNRRVHATAFYTNVGEVQGGVSDHTLLSSIGSNTHAAIDTHIADGTKHFTEGSIDHGSIAGLTDDDHTGYLLADGTRALTGNIDLGGNNLTGVGLITGDNHFTGSVTAEAFYTTSGGAVGGAITVKEVDGNPSVASVDTIVVTNGTLTDDGSGQVTITTGGGGSARFNDVTAEGFYVQSGGELSPDGMLTVGGTAAAPSISFKDDTDTGLYRSKANSLAIAVNGAKEAEFDGHGLKVENRVIADAFYFTTGGEVTLHTQPAVFRGALVSKSAAQEVANNTFADLTWETVHYDDGGWFGSSGDTFFTVPVGVTKIRLSSGLVFEADADGERRVQFAINDAAVQGASIQSRWQSSSATDTHIVTTVSAVIQVSAGDKLEVGVKHVAGAALDVQAGTATWFNVEAVEQTGIDTNFNNVTAEGFYVQSGGEFSPDGAIVGSNGTVSAPSISFVGDEDTGIYRPSANELAISTGGAQAVSFRPDSTTVPGVVRAEAFYHTLGGEAPRSYVENFTAALEWQVGHNLARTSFIAQAYKSNGKQVIPDEIDVSDPNTAYFYFAVAQDGKAVILGVM